MFAIFSLITLPIIFFYSLFLPLDNQPTVIQEAQNIDVKGIYWTGYTAGSKTRRGELINLINTSELNAVIIDVKDSTGRVFFDTDVAMVDEIGAESIRISDMKGVLAELKENNIYTIARIAVFQDPHLAENRPDLALKRKGGGLWRDWKGLAWVDTASREVWKYNIDVAKAAIDAGFDEINFDYIRFPSDGNLKQIVYPFHDENMEKHEALGEFFKYLDSQLQFSPVNTSVDLFGMVLWREDGLGIGQRYVDAAPHFDYIAPMVYPSHYPDGFEGFANPADNPYEIVYRSLTKIKDKSSLYRAKLRPWLQDFDLGAVYTPSMIREQIQATYDSGSKGWMLWNASNRYTEAGLLPTEVEPS